MSETAEDQDGGGVGFQAEEEAMRKRHKKESGVSKYLFHHFFRNKKSVKLLIKLRDTLLTVK